MPSIDGAAHRFYQDGERGEAPKATGLPPRETPLHPASPRLVVGALPHLAPEHGNTECRLRPIVGGRHACRHHQRPQGAQRPLQRARQGPCLVLPKPVLVQPMHPPRLPGLYRPCGRGCWCPVDQARQCRHNPAPKLGQRGLLARGQAARPAAQMRQAGGAAMAPVGVHLRTSADQAPGPRCAQCRERGMAPAGLPLAPGHRRVGHHPPPRHPPC